MSEKQVYRYVHMWEWSGNAKSDGIGNCRRTGNDLDVEEKERRVLIDGAEREAVKEQGYRLTNHKRRSYKGLKRLTPATERQNLRTNT